MFHLKKCIRTVVISAGNRYDYHPEFLQCQKKKEKAKANEKPVYKNFQITDEVEIHTSGKSNTSGIIFTVEYQISDINLDHS